MAIVGVKGLNWPKWKNQSCNLTAILVCFLYILSFSVSCDDCHSNECFKVPHKYSSPHNVDEVYVHHRMFTDISRSKIKKKDITIILYVQFLFYLQLKVYNV